MKLCLLIISALLLNFFSVAQSISLVSDISKGVRGSYPENLIVFGDKLVFSADDSIHGRELWYYTDSIKQVMPVTDIFQGQQSGIYILDNKGVVIKNTYYFGANDSIHGEELFKWDGVSKPKLVKDILPGTHGSTPGKMTILGNKIYFAACDSDFRRELWVYDVLTDSIRRLTGISKSSPYLPLPGSGFSKNIIAYNGKIYFEADTGISIGHNLYSYDPITDITAMVTSSFNIMAPSSLTVYNSLFYFNANINVIFYSPFSSGFVVYNGISQPYTLNNFIINRTGIIYHDKLFTYGLTSLGMYQVNTLTSYNSVNGNVDVIPLMYAPDKYCGSGYYMTVYHDRIYFDGDLQIVPGRRYLFSYDTIAKVRLIDSSLSLYHNFMPFGDNLYFIAGSTAVGAELFRFNDSGLVIHKTSEITTAILYPNPTSSKTQLDFNLTQSTILSFTITDITGKIVYNKDATSYDAGAVKMIIDLHSLPKGSFICRLASRYGETVWSGIVFKE